MAKKGFDPRSVGLPPRPEPDAVAPLPVKPKRIDWVYDLDEVEQEAWKAYDATLVVGDNDRVLADRVYQSVINQKRKHHGKKHPQHRDARESVDQLPRDAAQRKGRSPQDRGGRPRNEWYGFSDEAFDGGSDET